MKLNPLTKAAIGLTGGRAAYVLVQKGRHARSRTASTGAEIHGFVQNGYEAVREAFAENFARRREIGAACCVYHKGEKVVDLWGGVRNKTTGEPWEQNTMALVYSATKGLSAMTLAVAHSRGWLDYDELVCKYWPEFAQNEKKELPSGNCWLIRPGCSRSINRWINRMRDFHSEALARLAILALAVRSVLLIRKHKSDTHMCRTAKAQRWEGIHET
jgi:hypothetical protein